MVASTSVNCKVPLTSTGLVKIGCQFRRLVEASIRQVVLDRVWKENWKAWLPGNSLETIKTGGVAVTMTAKILVADKGGTLLSVTLTETELVPDNVVVFVHVNTPFAEIRTLVETDGRLNAYVAFVRTLLVADTVNE